MDLPKYQAFYKPILLFLQDGKAHSIKEIKQYTQKYFSLKEEDIIEKLASGGQTVFTNRNAWGAFVFKECNFDREYIKRYLSDYTARFGCVERCTRCIE